MATKKTEQKKWPEKWHEVNPGCMVFAAGNAANYKTGSWKSQRPLTDNAEMHQVRDLLYLLPRGMHSGSKGRLL